MLCERAGLAPDTELALFEEIRPNLVERFFDLNKPIEKLLEELMDGDIIIYQRADLLNDASLELPTAKDYLKEIFLKVEVLFCDKTQPNDPGFTMELSQKMSYEQMALAVGQRLGTESYLVQFFRCQSSHRDAPGSAIKCNYDGNLRDMLSSTKPRQRRIYYQQLTMSINELEKTKQIRCIYICSRTKEETDLVLYPSKTGTVADLLTEARKHIAQEEPKLGKLRLVDISGSRITCVPADNITLDALLCGTTKTFRVEEVPQDQLLPKEDELIVPAAHFHKESFSSFGQPFLIKLKHGEPVSGLRERIQRRLEVPDKEFERYRLAIVTLNKQHFLTPSDAICLNEFKSAAGTAHKPWLGIEHINKAPKRSRYNYMEKAIKIYN